MRRIGLRAARSRVIAALKDRRIEFDEGATREGKNLLQTGDVTPEYVVALLARCQGGDYEESPHHFDNEIVCHVFKPSLQDVRWYIKCYFVGDEEASAAVFISVHHSEA